MEESCSGTVNRIDSNILRWKWSWGPWKYPRIFHSSQQLHPLRMVSGFGRFLHAAAYRLHIETARKQWQEFSKKLSFEPFGRLNNDDDWCLLDRHHQVDWRSQHFSHTISGNRDLSYKTKTWSVKGEVRAYRQFKIVQMKDMSTSVPGYVSCWYRVIWSTQFAIFRLEWVIWLSSLPRKRFYGGSYFVSPHNRLLNREQHSFPIHRFICFIIDQSTVLK